uniref:Uncharacterized protein n=1 Tax=Arundo donax TaxID=35708 RepID=A0A0A9CAR6_ARUDO
MRTIMCASARTHTHKALLFVMHVARLWYIINSDLD